MAYQLSAVSICLPPAPPHPPTRRTASDLARLGMTALLPEFLSVSVIHAIAFDVISHSLPVLKT